jgi:hypothetical protein
MGAEVVVEKPDSPAVQFQGLAVAAVAAAYS